MILLRTEIFGDHESSWIEIDGNRIISIKDKIEKKIDRLILEIENSIAFPGLINSHDHLEFSVFPKLGNRKYRDYIEWGEDIHETSNDIINSILKIPAYLRAEYGIYKNVLNGVTTVVHHGPNFQTKKQIIDIHSKYNYLHSVKLQKNWKLKLNLTINSFPFVIHAGEGVNNESYDEINELISWNFFKKSLVGVHGIAMDEIQACNFKALVWCPVSNYFLYGLTAQIDKLKRNTSILFGTDSNVSSDWIIWDNLRFARGLGLLSDTELFNSLTSNAAKIWGLKDKGWIINNFKADLVIARKKNKISSFEGFYSLNPEDILLILKDGNIIHFDNSLKDKLNPQINISGYTEIELNGSVKFIQGKLNKLCREIKSYNPNIKFPFDYN
jgi:cytosine/adenosine deaminase-related metal-dependent hydrolase